MHGETLKKVVYRFLSNVKTWSHEICKATQLAIRSVL